MRYTKLLNWSYIPPLTALSLLSPHFQRRKAFTDKNNTTNGVKFGDSSPYSYIIVGSGTAGVTTAYFLSKWLEDNKIPGNVLLIERGVDFFSNEKGPSPRIKKWYDNWSSFSEVHDSYHANGNAYPVTPSDHRGVGGCSTHDTRITFQLRDEQKQSMAAAMGWSTERLESYYQTALNLMPISPAISSGSPVPFYTAVINELSLAKRPDDEHKTEVVANTIAVPSLAMYNDKDEVRWTPAYLMHDSIRPKNLFIATDAIADTVSFTTEFGKVEATGVNIIINDEPTHVSLEQGGKVVLTCGSINTPAILQRSGIGPRPVLTGLGIDVLVDNPSVGHGVDHEEIGIIYGWLDKWSDPDGSIPNPTMGWPIVLFGTSQSQLYQAHIGAGYAEPYTALPSFVVTPAVTRPDMSSGAGYHVKIMSRDPRKSCLLVQGDHSRDVEAMAHAAFDITRLFNPLVEKGIIGQQLYPPFEITEGNKEALLEWIRLNHWTVYHWACTCQAGLHGRVADELFRVRIGSSGVIENLCVGSCASLPQLSEANPHLTVSAFAIALAEELYRSRCERLGIPFKEPVHVFEARRDWIANSRKLKIRRSGEERPDLFHLAEQVSKNWDLSHENEVDT